MKTDDALIAMLLGESRPSPELRRWLATAEGRREMAAYREVLEALEACYREVASPRPTAYWCSLPTPIGTVLVAATDAGIVRVSFRRSEASFCAELRRRLDVEVRRSPARTADIVHQLRAYFRGERRAFEVSVDLRGVTPFQRRVLAAAAEVPAGRVVSYGDIARRIGVPGASRAVGQALGRNPVPIVIPCHRVVASGGDLGGYTGGLDVKRKLLRIEGALAATG
jgi:methylated-DNA-[protein]-cysteine S-methyltransferase